MQVIRSLLFPFFSTTQKKKRKIQWYIVTSIDARKTLSFSSSSSHLSTRRENQRDTRVMIFERRWSGVRDRQTERREVKWSEFDQTGTGSCPKRSRVSDSHPNGIRLFVLVNRRWRAIRFHRRDMLTSLPTTIPHPTDIQLWIFNMHYRIVSVPHRSDNSTLCLSRSLFERWRRDSWQFN